MIMKKRGFQKPIAEKVVYALVFVLFSVYALMLLYPFFFCLTASLSENAVIFSRNPAALPTKPNWGNYLAAITGLKVNNNSFLQMLANSLWYAGGASLLGIASSTCLAYLVSKYKFPCKNLLYSIALIVMIIPVYGQDAAKYRLLQDLNCLNSPMYLISAPWAFGIEFLLIYSFCVSIPWTYAEAAFIDGAGHFRTFFTVMIPLIIPSLTAMFVVDFIGMWSNYTNPLLFFPKMPTLSAGIYLYERKLQYESNEPVFFAGVLLSILPVLTLFVLFQNTIMQKVYTGGIKG